MIVGWSLYKGAVIRGAVMDDVSNLDAVPPDHRHQVKVLCAREVKIRYDAGTLETTGAAGTVRRDPLGNITGAFEFVVELPD